jgi:hypothetical protein
MSATLDQRKDGRDLYTQKYFGSIISANTLLHEFGLSLDVGSYHLHVTIVYYRGADEFTGALSRGGQLCSQLMIENMFRDQFRINMIAGMVKQLVAEGHRVYVFSEYLEGLELVLEQLTGLEVDLDAQRFTGKCTDKEIKDATNAQVILTSYGYGSTGVSIVTMTAEIYMTPRRAGFLQTIPRIMRKGSDPLKERRVIDIVDVGCPLQHQLKCRQLAYAHFDATIDSIVVKSDSNTPSRYVPPRS